MSVKCKKCNVTILWARTSANDKWIPLDATAPVYRIVSIEQGDKGEWFKVERVRSHHVIHYSTCPHANEFGKGRGNATRSDTSRPSRPVSQVRSEDYRSEQEEGVGRSLEGDMPTDLSGHRLED